MDATTRWETEALRTGQSSRPGRPSPSAHGRRSGTRWVTLREAEAATGIPVNTLRKWARKSDVPSYLESDGDLALRMVDLDAVHRRAKALGRDLEPAADGAARDDGGVPGADATSRPWSVEVRTEESPDSATDEPDASAHEVDRTITTPSTDTMMVPVDAWNKMLSQLGNLHEAGQQLAEARERAAKAETEAAFLRSRLAELRSEQSEAPRSEAPGSEAPSPGAQRSAETPPSEAATPRQTMTYWRLIRSTWASRRGARD